MSFFQSCHKLRNTPGDMVLKLSIEMLFAAFTHAYGVLDFYCYHYICFGIHCRKSAGVSRSGGARRDIVTFDLTLNLCRKAEPMRSARLSRCPEALPCFSYTRNDKIRIREMATSFSQICSVVTLCSPQAKRSSWICIFSISVPSWSIPRSSVQLLLLDGPLLLPDSWTMHPQAESEQPAF